jgi:ABC-type transport system substrate-binding protein
LYFMPVVRPYNPDGEGIGELMAGYLNEIGIQAVLASNGDWATYLGARANGELLGMYQLGWTGDNGDPDNFIGYFFSSVDTPLAREGFYQNAELAALLQEGRSLTDPATRDALYQQAEALLATDAGRLFIAHGQVPMAFNKKVSGYVTSPLGDEPFYLVTISQ